MKDSRRYFIFILLIPVFYLLAGWFSILLHEYAHSTTAWVLGHKTNPFAIIYGPLDWQNIFFSSGVDENVNYYLISLLGHPKDIGLIAFAGPGIATLGIYVCSLFLLKWQKIKNHPYLFYFIFWLNLINLSELISYVILRPFSAHGDIGHIVHSWGVSPWFIFLIGGFLLVIALWYFFTDTLIELYRCMQLDAVVMRALILIISAYILFAFPGIRMFLDSYGLLATNLGILFCILFPIVIILCWPTHRWVKLRLL